VGGLFILIFVSKEGGIGEWLEREGAKYRNYSTSIPFSPFPKHAAGEGATAEVKAWISRSMYCMLGTW
jgi:hypothetical protein